MVKVVVIDPGHGGKDVGASGFGINEKTIVLDIALQTKKILEDTYQDVKVYLTRSTDVFIELMDRSAKSNAVHADLFCAIHINASVSSSASGFETFIYNKSTSSTTKKMQQIMHKAILNSAPYFKDRGMNSANFSVLRNTHCSAILTESGFITNKDDNHNLTDAKVITALAKGHALGIAEFLNLQKKPVNTTKTIYKVVVGTYEDIKEATAIKNSLDKDFRNVSIITTKE